MSFSFHPHRVHVQHYSRVAANSLASYQPVVGNVHSCYARIINVKTPARRLLTLQGEGPLLAPCAVALAEDIEALALCLIPGALVLQNDSHTVGTPAALRLEFSTAQIWNGRLYPLPTLTASELHHIAHTLATWLRQQGYDQGLAPLLASLGAGNTEVLPPVCHRVCTALTPLLAKRKISTMSFLAMAAQLIGLGEGLTPSGDDFLVGFLAILHVTGRVSQVLPPPICQGLIHKVETCTSDLSAEFLRCALEGDFAAPIVCLTHALLTGEERTWPAHASSLANIGHSSGVDAMVGMVLACRLVASWLEAESHS